MNRKTGNSPQRMKMAPIRLYCFYGWARKVDQLWCLEVGYLCNNHINLTRRFCCYIKIFCKSPSLLTGRNVAISSMETNIGECEVNVNYNVISYADSVSR